MPIVIDLVARQEPVELGLDSNDRVVFTANYDSTVSAGVELDSYVFDKITALNLGIVILLGSKAQDPVDATCVRVKTYGGAAPLDRHDGISMHRPSVQVIVKAKGYLTARSLARTIHTELHETHNKVV